MNITINLIAFLLLAPGASTRLAESVSRNSGTTSPATAASIDIASPPPRSKQKAALAKKLSIQNIGLKQEPARISGFKRLSEQVVVRNETPGPFKDYADYSTRALSKVSTELRDYAIVRHEDVRVLLTENYSGLLALQPDGSTSPTVAHLQKRVCPADIPQLLDAMPDSRYFKKVLISENLNPEDDYVTQTYYPEGFISSMAMTNGQLELYKAERNEYLRRDVLHEWSHQLRYEYWDDKLMKCFEDSVNLELVEWNPSIYATRGAGEQWAVLGERMLGYSGDDFLEACKKAPIRTTLWMQALQKCFAALPEAKRSVDHAQYVARMEYVRKNVLPKAVKKLEDLESTGKTDYLREQARDCAQYLKATDWKRLSRNLALIFCLDRYRANAHDSAHGQTAEA